MNENTITKNFGIIPEFYFDLISRIPTGIFLFILLLLEFRFFSLLPTDWYLKIDAGFSVIIIIGLISIGQSLGIFLSVPGKHLSRIFFTTKVWQSYAKKDKELILKFIVGHNIKDLDCNKFDEWGDYEFQKIYRESHDFIRFKDEKAQAMLPKLSAETSLCNNASASLSILFIVHFINRSFYSNLSFYHWSFYFWWLLIIVTLIWLGKERYGRLLKSQLSFLRNIINKTST